MLVVGRRLLQVQGARGAVMLDSFFDPGRRSETDGLRTRKGCRESEQKMEINQRPKLSGRSWSWRLEGFVDAAGLWRDLGVARPATALPNLLIPNRGWGDGKPCQVPREGQARDGEKSKRR